MTILCERKIKSSFKSDNGCQIECFQNPIELPSFKISPDLESYFLNAVSDDSIVIINGTFHPSVYSISRLLKKHGIQYIAAPLDIYHPSMLRKNYFLKCLYWHLFEKEILKDAKAIQLYEINHSKWLQRLGVQSDFIEVPGGFLDDKACPASLLKWELRPPKLFFFGRVDIYHKGLDLLLKAFSEISQSIEISLTIQGPNEKGKKKLKSEKRRLAPKGEVHFLDPDYDRSPPSIIADYDIFCLPSRFEGFGLSALEAMLAGRVLLVSEEAGIAPHVKKSGCGVVVPSEVPCIKAGLLQLLECRSEWKEMGLKGREYAIKNLNWHKIAESTLKQYALCELDPVMA